MVTTAAKVLIHLEDIDPTTSPKWAELIAVKPSTVFHSPQWMRVVQQTYGLPITASILERDGRVAAGVAWSQVDDFLGTRRISLPYSDFCDILTSTPEEARTLAGVVGGNGTPWTLRSMARNLPQVPFPVTQSSHFKWHGIELGPDKEELWNGLTSMAQRGVKKAERVGVKVVQATNKGQLRDWYLLHLRTRKLKHGLLAQPYAFFENIWDAYMGRGQGFLLLAMADGQIISGTLYVLWKDTCYYKFNASDANHLPLRPNNLLMWQGILEAKALGCRLLDLGRSSAKQEGLVNFKRSFGAKEEDMYSNTYRLGDGESENERQVKHLLHEMTRLFVDPTVPDSVSEQAGTALYRYFV